MPLPIIHIDSTTSTNRWLAEHAADGPECVVWSDFQTAGRGCGTNTWESAPGQNLLFSVLLRPQGLAAAQQFRISMAVSVAIVRALSSLTDGLAVKWPNDIYWHDRKLGGMLIENRLAGAQLHQSIIGVGLNVNQTEFLSDAPNPVSLRQITGREHDREALLRRVLEHFPTSGTAVGRFPSDGTVVGRFPTDGTVVGRFPPDEYRRLLYRREGYHPYADRDGRFEARLVTVEDDGHLLLDDRQGRRRRYAFKEVQFLSH